MDLEHYKYVTVDDAADLCQPGRWLAKVDFKHADRSVGTHPDGWRDTGMSWFFNDSKHPTNLYDKRLPCGVRASTMVFHRLAQAISRMMAWRLVYCAVKITTLENYEVKKKARNTHAYLFKRALAFASTSKAIPERCFS